MVFAIIIGVLVVILLGLIVYMSSPPQPRLKFGDSPRDHGAEAWIEDHDIDEMIEARNERRRRLGWPELGDDLERELRESLARDGRDR
jgi:hypothetical protein